MNKIIKKVVIIFILIFILIGVIITVFVFRNKYQIVKVAKQLNGAITEHDISKAEEIVNNYPESVNALPSMSPWWWQLITEQPVVSYPLQTACWGGEYDIVKFLVDKGADVNLVWKGVWGCQSPLIIAVHSNSERKEEIVELLLEYGADKSAKDSIGKTAYDYAIEKGNSELAELLKP